MRVRARFLTCHPVSFFSDAHVQYKLKQSQRAKVRQFMAITGTVDHTAINCLTQNDWRLDIATDNFYQDPMKYYTEPPKTPVDRRKIDALFAKYRSKYFRGEKRRLV